MILAVFSLLSIDTLRPFVGVCYAWVVRVYSEQCSSRSPLSYGMVIILIFRKSNQLVRAISGDEKTPNIGRFVCVSIGQTNLFHE